MLAQCVVIPDKRRGLLVIFHQTGAQAVFVIVGTPFKIRRTAIGAFPIFGNRLGDIVVDFAAATAGCPRGDSLNKRLILNPQLYDQIKL